MPGSPRVFISCSGEPGNEAIRTCRWGYTCAERLFLNLQARGLGLQFKYRVGKISDQSKVKICMVNGQTAERELVKVLTRSRSCDYRVYGSDTPLKHACSSKDEGSLSHKTEMLL